MIRANPSNTLTLKEEGPKGQLSDSVWRVSSPAAGQQLTAAKTDLQRRVDDLVKSRDGLQTIVESLVDTRGTLEEQGARLTKARNAALEDAKNAQATVDQISDKLKAQTQRMVELQEQMTTIRSVLQQLQQELE